MLLPSSSPSSQPCSSSINKCLLPYDILVEGVDRDLHCRHWIGLEWISSSKDGEVDRGRARDLALPLDRLVDYDNEDGK